MPVLPYHKYIGPGNKLDSKVLPVDSDDRIALEHDTAYERGEPAKSADTHAIHDFIGDFRDTGNFHSVVGALGLSAKRGLEAITGQLYPRLNTMSRHHPYQRPDSSQDSGPPDTPGHFLSQESSGSIPRTPGHFLSQSSQIQSPMETSEAQSSQQSELSMGMGTTPGAGSGSGGMGTNVTDVFSSSSAPGTPFTRKYKKVFRFVQPASLTAFRRLAPSGESSIETVQYKVGSSTVLPLQQIFFYMDPREYREIVEHMGSFSVNEVNACVHSLGVRVPFNTAQTNIEVANNNLHIPVMDISSLADKYLVRTSADIRDWAAVIRGALHYNTKTDSVSVAVDEDWNTDFPNIGPYSETRIVRSRCIVDLPFIRNAAGTAMDVQAYTHAFPQIMLNCKKMILGSNYLGPAFHWSDKGHGILYKRSNVMGTGPTRYNYTTNTNDLARNHLRTNATQVIPHQSHFTIESASAIQRTAFQPQQVVPQGGLPSWQDATINGYDVASTNYKFKPLIFCQYNIRNFLNDVVSDTTTAPSGPNSIINTSFEYLLECNMTAHGAYVAPIYYNISAVKPQPDYYTPHLLVATDALLVRRPATNAGGIIHHEDTTITNEDQALDTTASVPAFPSS